MELEISAITVGERHRRDLGDLSGLAASIKALGLLHPVVVSSDNVLVCGQRRLTACRDLLGWETIPAHVVDIEDVILGERDENELRKDFTVEERVAIGEEVERRLGNRKGQRTDLGLVDNSPQVAKGTKTREEAAKKSGFDSDFTYRQAKKVVDNGTEKLRDAVNSGDVSISAAAAIAEKPPEEQDAIVSAGPGQVVEAARAVRQQKSAKSRAAAVARTAAVEFDAECLGKFTVVYADPPWRYEHAPAGDDNRAIENHYPTMSLEEICALPVRDIAHDDSVLFLWATSPKLAECMDVLCAWGFTHRTAMVWVKDKIGMGYYARARHEILLIAKRGELPPPSVEARPDSVVEAPRLNHSAKPPVFYDIIDRMYPGVRKIELFGRAPEERELWATWGNQAPMLEAAE